MTYLTFTVCQHQLIHFIHSFNKYSLSATCMPAPGVIVKKGNGLNPTTPCFDFIFQNCPPRVYQPGQITDRAVLNLYGDFIKNQADGFLMDRYKGRNLTFYYLFLV